MPPPDRDAAKLRAWFEREIADLRAEMAADRRELAAARAEAAHLHRIAVAMQVIERDNQWVQ